MLGSHDKPVRCVEYNAQTGTVLTGGWDAKFNAWDPRARQALVQSRPAPGKVCITKEYINIYIYIYQTI